MQWTQAIIRLQDIDHALAEHQARLTAIAAELDDTAELHAARQRVTETEVAAGDARRAQQDLEFELGQVQVKRERTEANLYSGRITNTRELQDLQAELQSLRRRIGTLEDDLLEAMIAREEADGAALDAAAVLAETRRQTELLQRALVEEQDRLQHKVADLQAERDALLSHIPASVIDSYAYLRKRIGSSPVAPLRGDQCGICGMVVTPPIRQQVQRGREAYCNNCGRLLVG
jgi:uncharacterized protein